MKKIFVLLIAFLMLFSLNANAGTFSGANVNDFIPKNEISDVKKSKKIKTIQKLLSTKVGKWLVKKTIKKLQKNQQKNDIKSKKMTKNRRGVVILSLGAALLIGGIVLLFTGYTLLGIILGVLGLAIIVVFVYLILLIGNAFSQYKGF